MDFDRYGTQTSCVAVESEPKPNTPGITIVGGIGSVYTPTSRSITFAFDFGSIDALSKSQLDTIYACRNLGAIIDRQKKNRIGLTISLSIPEAFDRLVRILDREQIE